MFFYQNNLKLMKHLNEFGHMNEKSLEFNFDDFEESNISGIRMESAIDDLIIDAQKSIDETIDNETGLDSNERIKLKNRVRLEIKNLWRNKINNWK